MTRKAGGVIRKTQDSIETMYHKRTTNKLLDILQHNSQPLRPEFDSKLIKGSGRSRAPKSRTLRYSISFVPTAVGLFNNSKKWLFSDLSE